MGGERTPTAYSNIIKFLFYGPCKSGEVCWSLFRVFEALSELKTVLGKCLSLCQGYRSSILGHFLKSAGSFSSIKHIYIF